MHPVCNKALKYYCKQCVKEINFVLNQSIMFGENTSLTITLYTLLKKIKGTLKQHNVTPS